MAAKAKEQKEDEEQLAVSPLGDILHTSVFTLYIHCVLELDKPVDISQAKKAICDILLSQSTRFSCIPRKNEKGVVEWKKTEVNVDDHVFVPHFPPHLISYDKYVEEYISDMHLRKLPHSRPLWEFHFINYKTTNGESTAILNLHHMVGDGSSIISLGRACGTSTQNPTLPPTLPIPSRYGQSAGKIHERAKPPTTWFSFNFINRILNWLFNVLLVLWYTLDDLIGSFLRLKWMEDSRFPIRGPPGVEMLPKAMASLTFTVQDIQKIKNHVGGSVNDVIMGVIFYGFRQYCEKVLPDKKEIENLRVTALALMNTRSRHGNKIGEEMPQSFAGARQGNNFAFLNLGVPMKKLKNPVEYVRRAKYMMDKKKMSVAQIVTNRTLGYISRFRGSKTSAKVMYNTLANTTLTVTNVNGPIEEVAFAGYAVKNSFFSVSGVPQTILVTCVGYNGNTRMQVITTKSYVDAIELCKCFEEALMEIKEHI